MTTDGWKKIVPSDDSFHHRMKFERQTFEQMKPRSKVEKEAAHCRTVLKLPHIADFIIAQYERDCERWKGTEFRM